MNTLEQYFAPFRENIIGVDQSIHIDGKDLKIVYADWTASGRMYRPIEELMMGKIYPFVANTHTETNYTGTSMTLAYKMAKDVIKKHVNAGPRDILIASNSGMTGVINKFQRILGLKLHERFSDNIQLAEEDRPIVFVTHMEHHSNQTTWLETIADVAIINACDEGKVDLNHYKALLEKYANRKVKIAAITSCSNVTGLFTPYHEMAKIIHQHGGLCFVDFACSAPYIEINMHPDDKESYLDAIYFSPHKFLGGPGSNGVLIFDSKLYNIRVPDHPGGGTVDWTNPWGEHKYHDEIEAREDGGTPGFLQTIRVALSIQVKDSMGVSNIAAREHEINNIIWSRLDKMDKVRVFAKDQKDRLPIFSFIVEGLHYNLGVKLLNDKFGVQVRGGCSCAGTYGHYLFEISDELSRQVSAQISAGDLSNKLGWIRISFHPTMTNAEVEHCLTAIEQISIHHEEWAKNYQYNPKTNEFNALFNDEAAELMVKNWFETLL